MPFFPSPSLEALLSLAADAGRTCCFHCLLREPRDAGRRDVPARDSGDLLDMPLSVAASELLLDTARRGAESGGPSPSQAACQLRVSAYVASLLMPPAVSDEDRCHTAMEERSAEWPPFSSLEALEFLECRVSLAVSLLEARLAEHDRGEWVDPNDLAGIVVEVHDAALDLERWWHVQHGHALR